MRKEDLVTVGDLEQFGKELINEIRGIVASTGKPKVPQKLLKTSDVLKLLPLSAGKLHTMRVNGTLPFTRLGGNVYYEPEEIDKLIEKYKTNRSDEVATGDKKRNR